MKASTHALRTYTIGRERYNHPKIKLKELINKKKYCLNRAELALENGAYDIVKDYSNNFIEYFMENIKRHKKKH